MLLTYNETSGYLHITVLKSRASNELIRAHNSDLEFWHKYGIEPNFLVLDNECPDELFTTLKEHGLQIQLAPPHNHRTNKAERYIR
jgi:hypothetical protein